MKRNPNNRSIATDNRQQDLEVRRQKVICVQRMLASRKNLIGTSVPETMRAVLTTERVIKVITQALSNPKNTALLECTPQSILYAASSLTMMGLEPHGPLQHAYLVPFKHNGVMEATPMIGFRGYIELARRSGEIQSVTAQAVREGDEFDIDFGSETLIHRPKLRGEPGTAYGFYSVARFRDGGRVMEYMSRDLIDRDARAHSKSYNYAESSGRRDSTWHKHYDEMARKSVIRRAAKYWPLCVDLLEAIALEDAEEEDVVVDAAPPGHDNVVEAAFGEESDGPTGTQALARQHLARAREESREDAGDTEAQPQDDKQVAP